MFRVLLLPLRWYTLLSETTNGDVFGEFKLANRSARNEPISVQTFASLDAQIREGFYEGVSAYYTHPLNGSNIIVGSAQASLRTTCPCIAISTPDHSYLLKMKTGPPVGMRLLIMAANKRVVAALCCHGLRRSDRATYTAWTPDTVASSSKPNTELQGNISEGKPQATRQNLTFWEIDRKLEKKQI